jgi:hypothetical protein
MTPDGYFKSGDIGVMDERLLQDRGPQEGHGAGQRLQRLPQRGGRRGGQAAGVLECAVVGVPDDKTGEAVKLVIVKKDPELTEAQVAYCKANLTGYKQPKVIEFRTELPKTPWARSCGANCATRSDPKATCPALDTKAPQRSPGGAHFAAKRWRPTVLPGEARQGACPMTAILSALPDEQQGRRAGPAPDEQSAQACRPRATSGAATARPPEVVLAVAHRQGGRRHHGHGAGRALWRARASSSPAWRVAGRWCATWAMWWWPTAVQHDMDASPLFPRFEVPLYGQAALPRCGVDCYAFGSCQRLCTSAQPIC